MTGGYGGVNILRGCNIAVDKGEIAVVVGPNGAGKSTAMKALFAMLMRRTRGFLGSLTTLPQYMTSVETPFFSAAAEFFASSVASSTGVLWDIVDIRCCEFSREPQREQ